MLKMDFKNASNTALVLANLIPLIRVVFYGWDAVLVLALFWIENLIIGAFNVIKMASVVIYHRSWGKAGLPFFFIIHFGLFWTIHGIILWDILGFNSVDPNIVFNTNLHRALDLPAEGAAIMVSFIKLHSPIIWLGLCGLIMSHLVSFIEHFLLRGEIFNKDVNVLMSEPYKNVVALHVGLLGGAFLLNYFESPIWLLAIIVLLKMLYDARASVAHTP